MLLSKTSRHLNSAIQAVVEQNHLRGLRSLAVDKASQLHQADPTRAKRTSRWSATLCATSDAARQLQAVATSTTSATVTAQQKERVPSEERLHPVAAAGARASCQGAGRSAQIHARKSARLRTRIDNGSDNAQTVC